MSKVLVSLSGGIDSTTLLGFILDGGHQTTAISFTYGSKHNKYENESARQVAAFYGVELIELDISQAMTNIESNLLLSGGEIPEGHYAAENMKSTVVPGRNMIFLSIMAGIAASRGFESLAIGVHSGDHAIYPDCRPDFISHMNHAIQFGTDFAVKMVRTPFINMDKRQIVSIGKSSLMIQPPYHLTRTCYKDQPLACGKCGSCVERLEAFEQNGWIDPVEYEVTE